MFDIVSVEGVNNLCGFMTPTRCLFLSDKLEMYLLVLKTIANGQMGNG
jgi:hypothetical protein